MSSTRYAAPGSPLAQSRYASSEEYRTALGGLLVAKRCSLLGADPELREFIWFLQERSLPDIYSTGGRVGSVELIADELLTEVGYVPAASPVHVEDINTGKSSVAMPGPAVLAERRALMVAELARALCELALSPSAAPSALPGLGQKWRAVLAAYRSKCIEQPRRRLAPTSVAQSVAEALRFTRDTRKLSLSIGAARLGKSASAKAFCASSGGLARYVLTPEDSDMVSLYRAIASALGVASGASMKANKIREIVERMLAASRLILVLDEAQNLFGGQRRPTREPQRILWLRRLIDAGVPIALVALPEFNDRLNRYWHQLDWDAAQITDLIAHVESLPAELVRDDFEVLVDRLLPDAPASVKKLVVGAANGQRGAQYVVDIVDVAQHHASKDGRAQPAASDVAKAIASRPQFTAPQKHGRGRPVPQQNRPGARSIPEQPAALPAPIARRGVPLALETQATHPRLPAPASVVG